MPSLAIRDTTVKGKNWTKSHNVQEKADIIVVPLIESLLCSGVASEADKVRPWPGTEP